MNLKTGDKVRFLHEKGEGIIKKVISAHKVVVELTEGLDIEVSLKEIVAIPPVSLLDIPATSKDETVRDCFIPRNDGKSLNIQHSKAHSSTELEIDLHIENITEHPYNLSNSQMLSLQLDYFQDTLEKAVKGHVKKLVFIHGVGNGVLRNSIRTLLKRYEGLEFSDASYKKYGAGATEVRIVSRNRAK